MDRGTGPLGRAVLFGALLLLATSAAPAHAQNAENDVIAVVERLFEGMRTRDTTMMRSTFDPSARLYGTGRDGSIGANPIDGFIASVGRSERDLDERIFAPVVQIDGDLATVWTFYTLHVDGNFSHCGVDAVMMYRTSDGWKIVSLADTRRTDNCEPPGR